MIKGLRNIKTMSTMSRQIALNNISNKAELSSCKTWVFTRKPKFVRFQKSLHVERIEEPHVDIFENSITKRDKTNTITVIAQIPVIRRRDIKVDIKGDILILDVETQHLTSVQGSSKLQ